MKHTSERITPDEYKRSIEDLLIYLIHEKTYEFSIPYVQNQHILDFGCGEGYGDHLLSHHAKHITAIDISAETIAQAQRKYPQGNITFDTFTPLPKSKLPYSSEMFDSVLSFQVIEHLENIPTTLKEIHRVLKTNGNLLLSTPNAAIRLLPFQNPWNKFHLTEFTGSSLEKALSPFFSDIEVSGLSLCEPWLSIEQKRINRNKWLLWPITNGLIPRRIRQSLLHWISNTPLRQKPSYSKEIKCEKMPDSDDVIVTKNNIMTCPNIIVTCKKHSIHI